MKFFNLGAREFHFTKYKKIVIWDLELFFRVGFFLKYYKPSHTFP